MSLGFLTESALLPSKAKEIKVDSKSILDLKAVVFQKEQERKERRRRLAEEAGEDVGGSSRRRKRSREGEAEEDTARGGEGDSVTKSVYARLKAQKKRTKHPEPTRNRGVESRSRRDDEQRELDVDNEDDDEALQRKSRAMLERKAKLYEQMMQGRRDAVPSAAVKECLVDFDEKRRATGAAAMVFEGGNAVEAEKIEITDEFGRTRMVKNGSAAHLEYARTQQQPQSLYYEDKRRESGDRETNEPEETESAHPSGSFVVSQWEKTLNASEKQYLEQVHAGVQLTKQSAMASDKQSRKQQRLEKLRRQQQQTTTAAVVQQPAPHAPVDPQQAKDAEQKATAFLSQFTSLL